MYDGNGKDGKGRKGTEWRTEKKVIKNDLPFTSVITQTSGRLG